MIPKKILLIEDDMDLVQLFADALTDTGFTVDMFTDPAKAYSVFKKNPKGYDLILSDIRMPGMSGLDLIKKIKKINLDVNVILMSALETESFQSELREEELNTFLKKPMHIDQLVKTVKETVEKESELVIIFKNYNYIPVSTFCS